MNNQEARFILQGYRPGGADASDATFSIALDQARLDPALGEWFARAQAFDAAVSAKLGEVPAPAGLRDAILAGGRMTASAATGPAWWRSFAVMSAAAGIALLLAFGFALWPKRAAADVLLTQFALKDALHSGTHGGHGEDTASLQAALSDPRARLSRGLPVDFAALRKAGCRTVSFQGHEVFEVCFQRDGAWFHCYIAQRADFPTLVAALNPVVIDRDEASTAAWTDAAHLFVVVSKAGRAPLERLL